MIAIIDYGMGNIHSVRKALEVMGAKTCVTNSAQEIAQCQKIVLPGVGAFGDAMRELKARKLIGVIKAHILQKKPFLGICLGMHLLFEKSEESPSVTGLGIVKGQVKRFSAKKGLKVPHMGWNQLNIVPCSKFKLAGHCPLLENVKDNSFVYFCHSYYPAPKDSRVSAALTEYGNGFTSVVWQDNVYGAQFHPEKSQEVGLRMIKNFVEL